MTRPETAALPFVRPSADRSGAGAGRPAGARARGVAFALALALCAGVTLAPAAHAQERPQSGQWLNGEVVKIDTATNVVTLKSVMGHRVLKVRPPSLLANLKPGDVIQFAINQDGNETVLTEIRQR
jgi:Cu/Ag efflux protein CusF